MLFSFYMSFNKMLLNFLVMCLGLELHHAFGSERDTAIQRVQKSKHLFFQKSKGIPLSVNTPKCGSPNSICSRTSLERIERFTVYDVYAPFVWCGLRLELSACPSDKQEPKPQNSRILRT